MENNGKGIFYGVIGVATLIVAIIGATFAYFTASATNADEPVTGSTETVGLALSVVEVDATKAATTGLIPLNAADIDKALAGDKGQGVCKDNAGYTVCRVYEATVTNNGTNPIDVVGNVKLTSTTTADEFKDIRVVTAKSATAYTTVGSAVGRDTDLRLVGNTDEADHITTTQKYYFVVYFENVNDTTDGDGLGNQDAQQGKSYNGIVTFSAAGSGAQLQATFSA